VRPTPAGALLAARARRALDTVRGFADDLAALEGLERGTLRIAAIQSLAVTLLPPALVRFARRHPGIEISVNVAGADDVTAAVRDGRADLGLVAGPAPPPSATVSAELLYREAFVAVVRASDPLARRRQVPLSELRQRPLVLVPLTSPTGVLIHAACASAGFAPLVRLTIDSGEVLRALVRSGVGLTILPERYLAGPESGLRAVRLVRPTPRREVLVLRAPGTTAPAAEALLALLRARRPAPGAATAPGPTAAPSAGIVGSAPASAPERGAGARARAGGGRG
jgi:LysR family cyn operon transcriptional activator